VTAQDLFHRARTFFHFIGRLLYRLVCWVNYPTSRERMWHMYSLGKAQGNKEALKSLPITQVVQPAPLQPPEQHTDPATVLHYPTGELSRGWHRIEVTGAHPTITGALRSIKLTQDKQASPRYTKSLDHHALADVPTGDITPPKVVAVQLQQAAFLDDSWLNTREEELLHDPFLIPVEDDGYAVTEHKIPVVGKHLNAHFYPNV
jgi:hypothetical protein